MATASPRKVPIYRLHKASGQAVVVLDGRDKYLGKHGSPRSHEKYRRAVAEWLSTGSVVPRDEPTTTPGEPLTVAELVLAFWKHAQGHYHPASDGSPSDELGNIRASVRPLRSLYGMTPARDFGPKALRAVRDQMIADGLARPTINARINRLRHIFKWGASYEMVPVAVVQALATVAGLQKGRTMAREPEPVKPVPRADVEKTLPFLTRPVAGLVRFELLTGCRPSEACMLRGRDITRGEGVWLYRPPHHKNAHRGKDRYIFIGPQAQAVLADFVKLDLDAYLFDPGDAVPPKKDGHSRPRPVRPKKKSKTKAKPETPRHRRYHRATYLHAITRACLKAGVEPWSPNQLRHTFATEVRASHDAEAVRTILGHSRLDTTEIYAERDLAKSRSIIKQVG